MLNSHSEEAERAAHVHGDSGKHTEICTKDNTENSGRTAGQSNGYKNDKGFLVQPLCQCRIIRFNPHGTN